ncbi:MAG: DUF1015 domain-containing protein [Bacteroidota bacterium]
MAEIKPLRAWRYNPGLSGQLEKLIAPLFDIVTATQRNRLYSNPLNSIHLSVPRSGLNPAGLLENWKSSGVLLRDDLPTIFAYAQHYAHPVTGKEVRQTGFICNIRTRDWPDRVILHHENTIPTAVNDRAGLLEETGLHTSPTHGLYDDPDKLLEPHVDAALRTPLHSITDDQGIRHDLGLIHDHRLIRLFIDHLAEKPVILADGHHRYEASIRYSANHGTLHHPTDPARPQDMHLMCLTNTSGNDLTILPTHRLISGIPDFNADQFLKQLESDFLVTRTSPDQPPQPAGEPGSFGIITTGGNMVITLKPGLASSNPWPFPNNILNLDLTILHYFIVEKLLGIPGTRQRAAQELNFERDARVCQEQVRTGLAQTALLTNPVSIESILSVCNSGHTLPQKSTYFYPKMVSGLVFSSVLPQDHPHPDLGGY